MKLIKNRQQILTRCILININKLFKYLEQQEELIELRTEELGDQNHPQILKLKANICQALNKQGVILLKQEDVQKSFEYLKKAEIYAKDQNELSILTMNNLACFYRKCGKLKIALQYLQQALKLELILPNSTSLSDTYLNMCAVLSQLNKHEEAIESIYLSIIMLQHQLLMKSFHFNQLKSTICRLIIQNQIASREKSTTPSIDENHDLNNFIEKKQIIEKDKNEKNTVQFLQDKFAVLVVAYHNLGVEMEHLKKNFEAQKIFQSAYNMGIQTLPSKHKMIDCLKSTLQKYTTKTANQLQQSLRINLPYLGQQQIAKPKLFQLKKTYSRNSNHSNNVSRSVNKQDQLYVTQSHSPELGMLQQKKRTHPSVSMDKDETQNKIIYTKNLQTLEEQQNKSLLERSYQID